MSCFVLVPVTLFHSRPKAFSCRQILISSPAPRFARLQPESWKLKVKVENWNWKLKVESWNFYVLVIWKLKIESCRREKKLLFHGNQQAAAWKLKAENWKLKAAVWKLKVLSQQAAAFTQLAFQAWFSLVSFLLVLFISASTISLWTVSTASTISSCTVSTISTASTCTGSTVSTCTAPINAALTPPCSSFWTPLKKGGFHPQIHLWDGVNKPRYYLLWYM